MKLLVTGGAGFIGSNYVRYLLRETDDEVVVYDSLTYAGNLSTLKDVDDDPRVLANPVLDEFSEETEEADEGCLSVPGVTMPMIRSPGTAPPFGANLTGRSELIPRTGLTEALRAGCAESTS